jgi:hypothetical protein
LHPLRKLRRFGLAESFRAKVPPMLTFSGKSRSRRRAHGLTHSSSFSPLDGEPLDRDSSLPPETVALRKGWHDSSMDLRRGLVVTEDVAYDTIPLDLQPPPPRRR